MNNFSVIYIRKGTHSWSSARSDVAINSPLRHSFGQITKASRQIITAGIHSSAPPKKVYLKMWFSDAHTRNNYRDIPCLMEAFLCSLATHLSQTDLSWYRLQDHRSRASSKLGGIFLINCTRMNNNGKQGAGGWLSTLSGHSSKCPILTWCHGGPPRPDLQLDSRVSWHKAVRCLLSRSCRNCTCSEHQIWGEAYPFRIFSLPTHLLLKLEDAISRSLDLQNAECAVWKQRIQVSIPWHEPTPPTWRQGRIMKRAGSGSASCVFVLQNIHLRLERWLRGLVVSSLHSYQASHEFHNYLWAQLQGL